MSESVSPWGILTGIRPVKIASKLIKSGKSPAETSEYFVNEFGTTREKAELAVKVAMIESPIIDAMHPQGISIYIGIPFCPTRCLYCSFVSNSVVRSAKLIPEYLKCLKKEIAYTANIIKQNKKDTIYAIMYVLFSSFLFKTKYRGNRMAHE